MKAFTKFLVGGAGLAALAAAAPAAAQYYPPYGGYPGGSYPGGGYGYPGQGGGIADILGQILGGRSYASNERYAVEQCVRAVEYRINTRGLDNEGGRYRNYRYGQGYDNRYGGGYMGARVTAVTQVQRRSNGGLKVFGYATTNGQGGYGGYGGGPGYGYGQPGYPGGGYGGPGYGNAYGYGYQQGDAQFDCTIDRYGRITDIDAKRNRNYGYRRY
jgi:hypothetical protein